MNAIGAGTIHSQRNGTGANGLQPPHALERLAVRQAARGADELLVRASSARVGRCTAADFLRFAIVAVYLACAMTWLVVTRQIRPNFSVRRSLRALLARHQGPRPLGSIVHDAGHCYRAAVDPILLSDVESISRVQVYENGVALPRARCDHETIRHQGRGTFSHWNGMVYFSATDNSDPRTNGRGYTYQEVRG
ncbi:MAG TPA: hypothetical protein VKE94_05175 [Gemmataceae bacterium]|nr:hypothetical protein [Gemmataceae bacterium]